MRYWQWVSKVDTWIKEEAEHPWESTAHCFPIRYLVSQDRIKSLPKPTSQLLKAYQILRNLLAIRHVLGKSAETLLCENTVTSSALWMLWSPKHLHPAAKYLRDLSICKKASGTLRATACSQTSRFCHDISDIVSQLVSDAWASLRAAQDASVGTDSVTGRSRMLKGPQSQYITFHLADNYWPAYQQTRRW